MNYKVKGDWEYILCTILYDIIIKILVQPSVILISQITDPKSIITNMYI
jgi:hypothetical protein